MLRYALTERPWYLEGRTPDGNRWTIPVGKSPFLIGRSEDCDLALLDRTVSRRHAEISYDGCTPLLRDLESTNGTFVNQRRVRSIELASGDTIHLGDLKLEIVSGEDHRREAASGTMFVSAPPRKQGFAAHYELTRRQEEILAFVLQGMSTRSIADELCVSFGTVKNHLFNIFRRCGVHSRYELIALYNNFSQRKPV